MTKFDEAVAYFSNLKPVLTERAVQTKLYTPTSRAFEVGFPHNSVEGQVINFLDEKPSSLEELIRFIQSNFEEYYKTSICKEKIRQMLLDGLLDFADEDEAEDEGKVTPELEFGGDGDYYDPEQYLPPGALADYRKSYGHF